MNEDMQKVLNELGKQYYQDRIEKLKQLGKITPKGHIVFIGDSITEGFPVTELLTDYKIFNRGVSGDTTDDLISHLNNTVLSCAPRKVFMLIGTNDLNLKVKVADIVANIEKAYQIIRRKLPKIEVYIQSVYPVNRNEKFTKVLDNMVGVRTNGDIKKINGMIKKLAEEEDFTYIDLWPTLSDENGQLKENYTIDGLHLNVIGYAAVANKLKDHLQ